MQNRKFTYEYIFSAELLCQESSVLNDAGGYSCVVASDAVSVLPKLRPQSQERSFVNAFTISKEAVAGICSSRGFEE